MIRGIFVAAFVLARAACEPVDEDGVSGKIELDMMDDGTIVSNI